MSADEDAFARGVRELFAGEATSRIDDVARAQRLADAAVRAAAAGAAEPERDPLQAYVVASFDDEAMPRAGDAALAARLADGIPGVRPRPARRRVGRLLGLSPVAAILLVSSGVLAATVVATAVVPSSWVPWRRPAPATARHHTRPEPRAKLPITEAPAGAPPSVESVAPESPPPSVGEAPAPQPVRPDSVAQLFERANQLRRQGRVAAAERAYAALVARHPRATEAGLARLSLADLLAAEGRHGAALAQADAYLRVTADGALTEEALQRKARALEALGRTTAARAAWRALLDRNPASVYRAEAEQKLARPTRP